MPLRLESSLQRACVKYAREKGCMVMKVETIANVGWPDIVVVPPLPNPADENRPQHSVLWVEFKRPGEELTPIQLSVQRRLAQRGQRVYTVNYPENFKELLAPYV